jgi:hypothetical protein
MTTPASPPPAYTPVRRYQPVAYTEPQTRTERMINRIPAGARQVNLPGGAPRFLGDRGTIFYAWTIAMLVVGYDEWHNLNILPRPSRLWDTSLVYGLLALMAVVDPLVPIANALAVGFTISLLWRLYNGNLTPAKETANPGTTGGNPQPTPQPNPSPTPPGVTRPTTPQPSPTPAPGA